MRLTRLTLLAAASLALAACAPKPPSAPAAVPPAGDVSSPVASDPAAMTPAQRLAAYVWHLREAKAADGSPLRELLDTPGRMLALRFEDGRISMLNGCNRMGGRASIEAGALHVSGIETTLMACADRRLMDMDRVAARVLEGRLAMSLGNGTSPSLQLSSEAGEVLLFEGEPTDETRYGHAGESVFLEVAAHTEPCHHPLIPNKQCLQVREVRYDAQGIRQPGGGDFEHFYEVIQGYEHEPGIRNVLRVKRYDIANPPADGSRHAWVLDSVTESARETP